MDTGIQQASRLAPVSPLPVSWLGRADVPTACPAWSTVTQLSAIQQRNLLAQISYFVSAWDYKKIGTNNKLGRYQVSTQNLENYGLLAVGSNASYGTDCVNYQHCWQSPIDTYAEYLVGVENLGSFLKNTSAQDSLSYYRLSDLYNRSIKLGIIKTNDSADVVAGMLYVAWELGVGTATTTSEPYGTGAYAWRYFNVGNGASYYNAGRYAVSVLTK
jgi:hypothetical protein